MNYENELVSSNPFSTHNLSRDGKEVTVQDKNKDKLEIKGSDGDKIMIL